MGQLSRTVIEQPRAIFTHSQPHNRYFRALFIRQSTSEAITILRDSPPQHQFYR